MWEDLRFVVRQLLRSPGFTLVAVLSLAFGAGVNSTIFSLIDGMYMRPLGVPDAGRVVRIFTSTAQDPYGLLSYPECEQLRTASHGLQDTACFMRRGARFQSGGARRILLANITSPDFFQALGVLPLLGRLYGPAAETAPVAVLGYNAWRRYFGGDPAVVGRTIQLTQARVTIIGILPDSFRDTHVTGDQDLWAPPQTWTAMIGGSPQDFENRSNRIFETLARLAPGATLEQADSELSALAARLQSEFPRTNRARRFTLVTDFEWRSRNAGNAAVALFGIVLLVVVTACVNVANLMLSRAERRRRELALRAALGAGRWRLARLFFLEGVLLGGLGLGAGLLLGFWLVQALPSLLIPAPGFPSAADFRLDSRVLGATTLVSLLTVALTSLAPILNAARLNLTGALRGLARSGSPSWPLRDLLAASQVALSLVLLSTAGILGASFWKTRTADIGWTRQNPLVVWVTGARDRYREAETQVSALPGVRRAAVAMRAPFSLSGGGMAQRVSSPGHPELEAARPVEIRYNTIDHRFLALMGLRVLRGRGFDISDMTGPARYALINETMARRYWPDRNPVGQMIQTSGNDPAVWEIAGVVSDAPVNSLSELPQPYFYLPYWNATRWDLTFLIESSAGDAAGLAPAIRRTLKQIDPTLEPASIASFDELLLYSSRQQALMAELAVSLAALGLVLNAVGLSGVLAYTVTRRRREIGIRMALGAGPRRTLALVLWQAGRLLLAGASMGLPAALVAARALRSLLFGIQPWHPPSFAAAAALLLLAVLMAAWAPALRATRIDPVKSLRLE